MNYDETRLPKWAQQRLKVERENAAWYAELAMQATDKDTTSDTEVDPYNRFVEDRRFLPSGTLVRFGGKNGIFVRTLSDGTVQAYSTLGRLSVRPRATNSVNLVSEPFS